MKNLENYGVQKMSAKEIEETDGGYIRFFRLLYFVYDELNNVDVPSAPYVDYAGPSGNYA